MESVYIKGYEKAWHNTSVQLPQLWDGIYFTGERLLYMSMQFVSFIPDHNYAPRLNPIPRATVVSNELLVSPISIMREESL